MSGQPFLRAADIHARVGAAWPSVLADLGIAPDFLRLKKSGPCPVCGGHDRYVFDNRLGRGDFLCRQCGAGDGFELLRRVHGWDFAEARRRVLGAVGADPITRPVRPLKVPTAPSAAEPTDKVRAVSRSACPVADCQDAAAYLESRGLWPLPVGCTLKAHPSLEYWHDGERSRHPGLVAEVRDVSGDPVTVHVTYLRNGKKLDAPDCRKLLSPLTWREGCAVRLMPATDELGVAEGIETALSAAAIDGLPVWAALNASLLARFEPPPGIKRLHVYADRDAAGLTAAIRLTERLRGRVELGPVRIPAAPANDFNDQLLSRRERPKDSQ